MRILWVKVGALWPLNSGGRIRSFNILKELSQHHSVVLLTTHGPTDDPEAVAAGLDFCERVVSLPYAAPKQGTLRFLREVASSWLSPLPVDVRKWRAPQLRQAVGRLLESGQVDLCVADFLTTAVNVPFGGPVPVVFFDHNVEHVIWKRLGRTERRPWRRLLLEMEWRKMRRWEARTCARATLTLAVSEQDRALLAETAPGANVSAIPTGVDTAYFTPNGRPELSTAIVFTGSMDWYPNEDAVLQFADAILPLIRREVPAASVTVVGRDPSPRLRAAAARAGLRLTGLVEDVRPYVAEAAVYVVPLRVGGGTRLKVFEALAMAKPVVSTTVGAEGLPLVPGEHFLRADDPAAFAQAVVSLLRDPDRRRSLGTAGRRLVEERYSWSQVAREFEARCREAVSS
jgi:sugar transferase (PEP-CTERM/EpsH1 system associated)